LAAELGEDNPSIWFQASWSGLAGRKLGDVTNQGFWPPTNRISRQPSVTSTIEVTAAQLDANLASAVETITRPLYEAFDFFVLSPQAITTELDKLRKRRG
jgi:hypothetical protein